ncbi:uncharacterized protein RJT21DRAFT_114746 [Scheffersomyces amazonensis]|uniref:uncharacterized protein n=1 Tax=Scheffersomyces amazonensis TaxID=1078765 RepID=UPI00315CC52A
MLSLLLLSLLTTSTITVNADGLGCFSSLPSSAKSVGSYTYQTQSYCAGQCQGYAYVAVKNGIDCYCLNSLPSSNSVSSSQCSVPCAGYGSATCGGVNSFEVFAGNGNSNPGVAETGPSSGAASTASTQTTTSSTGNGPSTTSNPATSSSADSDNETVQVVTSTATNDSGVIVYKTITQSTSTSSPTSSESSTSSSASPSTSGSSSNDDKKKSSSKVGPIVGGVIGGLVALSALIGGIFWFIKRRYSEDDDDDYDEEKFYDSNPSGLGRRGGTGKGTRRNNKDSALDMPIMNPFVHPNDQLASSDHSQSTDGMPTNVIATNNQALVDPRLNPSIMGRKRLSEGSLADETDYSRKILHVINPDSTLN